MLTLSLSLLLPTATCNYLRLPLRLLLLLLLQVGSRENLLLPGLEERYSDAQNGLIQRIPSLVLHPRNYP